MDTIRAYASTGFAIAALVVDTIDAAEQQVAELVSNTLMYFSDRLGGVK